MGKITDYLTGRDLLAPNGNGAESRTLARTGTEREQWSFAPRTSLPPVSEATALRVADVYAAIKVLADSLSSLPVHVYRETPRGRVRAGEDQRLAALLQRPAPGQTSADLVSQIVVDLAVNGNAFVGKFRREGEIEELGLLPPDQVTVERRGGRVAYVLMRNGRRSEHGPGDVVHVRGMSRDGLRGLSPVRQCAKVLQLDEGLISFAVAWCGNSARPSGILAISGDAALGPDRAADLKHDWQTLFDAQGPNAGAGRIAVLSGDGMTYEAVDPPMRDQEFTRQRELACREIARIFNLPPWALGVSSGDSLTYSTVQQQARHLVDFTLRPLAVKIERALSGDPDLCPGSTYLRFEFDGLLRADTRERYAAYREAIEGGWMTVDEVRELEDRPPLEGGDR